MNHPLWGVALRVGVMYLYVLAVVRLSGKRTLGALSPQDFVVTLIIGDLFDDVFWKEVPLANGLVAISTIIACHLLLSVGTWRWEALNRLFGSGSTRLVYHGRVDARGMQACRFRPEDLQSHLRAAGIDGLAEIEEAHLESNGKLSVLLTREAKAVNRRELSAARSPA
jgi:uncharacterized membrane protein YcaP (DUF421 family)